MEPWSFSRKSSQSSWAATAQQFWELSLTEACETARSPSMKRFEIKAHHAAAGQRMTDKPVRPHQNEHDDSIAGY